MILDDSLLQLHNVGQQLAQLSEPFPATMGVTTHPGGGTAHEDQDLTAALAPACSLVRRLLTRASHTKLVEASPRSTSQRAAFGPLGHPTVDLGAVVDDLVLRRFPTRT